MYLYQQYSVMLSRYSGQETWVTLARFENREDAERVMSRPYSDGRSRTERVIAA